MLLVSRFAATTAALSLLVSLPSHSTEAWDFSGQLTAGMEQQSNVNISQLEQATGQADVATLLSANLAASWQLSPAIKLSSGYNVQDKNYRTADDFNTRLQLAHLDASYQYGATTYGSNYYYALADLAGERFLTLNQASVYAMHSLKANWLIRPAITLTDKRFASVTARNAENYNVSTDSFWFFADGQHFITLGLLYEDENSLDDSFSYRAPGLRVKLSGQFSFWQLTQQVQVGVKVSRRQYQQAAEENSARQDTHTQLQAEWQLKLSPAFSVLTAIEHGDFNSTLSTADYKETRSSVSLQYSF